MPLPRSGLLFFVLRLTILIDWNSAPHAGEDFALVRRASVVFRITTFRYTATPNYQPQRIAIWECDSEAG